MTAATASIVDVEADRRDPVLDGVRGLAAVIVIWFHFVTQPAGDSRLTSIVVHSFRAFGWTGVDLFFVLSGFLITGLLIDAKGSTNYFRVFYARRALRILPLYYLALTLLFAVPVLLRNHGGSRFIVPFPEQLYHWFYLQNFHRLPPLFDGLANHLWSLAIEEQFYLVWPVVIFFSSRSTALKACVACLLISLFWRIAVSAGYLPAGDNYFLTPARLDGLGVGSGLAVIARLPDGLERIKRFVLPAMVIAVVIVGLRKLLPTGYNDHATLLADRTTLTMSRLIEPFYFTAIAVFYGGMLFRAVTSKRSAILKSRFLGLIGRYSYGIYVIHVPAIPVAYLLGVTPATLGAKIGAFPGLVAYTVLMTGFAFSLAWLSWNIYERRFLALKRYFVYDRGEESKTPRKNFKGVSVDQRTGG